MDLSTTTNQGDPHSKRLMVDKAEWHARLERFAEIRARLDEDAASVPPIPLCASTQPLKLAQAFVMTTAKETPDEGPSALWSS